jgi:ankyrin repeat protein
LVILVIVTILALSPVRLHYYVQYQMASALDIAIRREYPIQTISMIVDRYPNLVNDGNPLASAAYQGRTNVVEVLIKKGANVDRAVEYLQQLDARDPLALVLKLSECHNNSMQATPNGAPDG